MGNITEMPAWFRLVLVLLMTGSMTRTTIASHICPRNERVRKEVDDYCGSYVNQIISETNLPDVEQPPLNEFQTTEERTDFLESERTAMSDPNHNHAMCKFFKMVEEPVTGCCDGWEGDNCDIPICIPQCVHGVCESAYTCTCDDGYAGDDCSERLADVTDTKAYCYANFGCYGDKLAGFEDRTVTEEECTDDGGKSWGVQEDENGIRRCKKCEFSAASVVEQVFDSDIRTCLNNGKYLYRTFDGQYFYFCGTCHYNMAAVEGEFYVELQVIGCSGQGSCEKRVIITFPAGDAVEKIVLAPGSITVNNSPITVGMVPTPVAAGSGISMMNNGDFLLMSYKDRGLYVKYDGKDDVWVSVDKERYDGRTRGLCGLMNNDPYDDLVLPDYHQAVNAEHFGNAWVIPESAAECPEAGPVPENCDDSERAEAENACGKIHSYKFRECAARVNAYEYYEMCINQYCGAATDEEKAGVVCDSLEDYTRQCTANGVVVAWRSETFCPKTCADPSMVYTDCASLCPRTCAVLRELQQPQHCMDSCVPGCQCPTGTYIQDGKCVRAEECQCVRNNKKYNQGAVINAQCNKCTCNLGSWICSEDPCPATCNLYGLGHVNTFDSLYYQFKPVKGTYTLVEPITGEAENDDRADVVILGTYGPCTSDIADFVGEENCLKSLDLQLTNTQVHITSDFSVIVGSNNDVSNKLPYQASDVRISRVTSDFIHVKSFGFDVKFNPYMVYISMFPFFKNKMRGLCGRFNYQADDDMTTRMDLPEVNPDYFAGSYCVPTGHEMECSCSAPLECAKFGPQYHAAVSDCRVLIENPEFEKCHQAVSPELYYEMCIFDSCKRAHPDTDFSTVCNYVTAYAFTCKMFGIDIDVTAASACGFDSVCSGGMVYTICSNTCGTNCKDLASKPHRCDDDCVPGCVCPNNEYLISGPAQACVPSDQCTCFDEFAPDEINMPGDQIQRQCKTCTCTNGAWDCDRENCAEEEVTCPKNQVYGPFNPSCEKTCYNIDSHMNCPESENQKGCTCEEGMVKGPNGTCVSEDECACRYDQKWYQPGETVMIGCRSYKCIQRRWVKVQDFPCPGFCYAAGDPHYHTLDGLRYSFQGQCTYILARDKLNGKFSIKVENVKCGSSGVSCTKALDVTFENKYNIRLVRGIEPRLGNNSMPDDGINGPAFTIYSAGMFTVISAPQLGLQILWNSGTLVYVYLEKDMWKNKVEGLCGNYNGNSNEEDEFNNQDVISFGNSMKDGTDCVDTVPVSFGDNEPCGGSLTHRAKWADDSCKIIKEGDLFAECRAKIGKTAYEYFHSKCMEDACKCDMGGDCECLCTILALFGQECARAGAVTKWRSNKLCPMMCEYSMQYSPCTYACPQTCRNIGDEPDELCSALPCVEGCVCPPGTVRQGYKCVAAEDCPCYFNGVPFPSGTVISNNCQNCTCISGTFECEGELCEEVCSDDEFECEPGVCTSLYNVCDGYADCVNAADEADCNIECGPEEFRCLNGHCIPADSKCDQVVDCNDRSDELNCDLNTCEEDEFTCMSGHCIPMSQKCDGEYDCGAFDESDEEDCPIKCSHARYFQCIDGNGESQCYPDVQRCDGHDDCGTGLDEIGCLDCSCGPNEVVCQGTCQCIDRLQECDGVDNCPFGTDEADCPCDHDEFSCDFDRCINQTQVCDGTYDCSDYSDEMHPNCIRSTTVTPTTTVMETTPQIFSTTPWGVFTTTQIVTTTPRVCDYPEYQCEDESCITPQSVCDQKCDCYLCEEEEDCATSPAPVTTPAGCSDDEFSCDIDKCIDASKVCDGTADCNDGTDESHADCITTLPPCSPPNFSCDNGQCIEDDLVCDGVCNCGDCEEEEGCLTTTEAALTTTEGSTVSPCLPPTFQCTDMECVEPAGVCNGVCDCTADCSDEFDCGTTTPLEMETTTESKCSPPNFQCDSGDCIQPGDVCDGTCNCDFTCEDEINCLTTTEGVMTTPCPVEMKDGDSPELSIEASSSAPGYTAQNALSPSGSSYWSPDSDNNPMLIMSVSLPQPQRLINIILDVRGVDTVMVMVGVSMYTVENETPDDWTTLTIWIPSNDLVILGAGDMIFLTFTGSSVSVRNLYIQVCEGTFVETTPSLTTTLGFGVNI